MLILDAPYAALKDEVVFMLFDSDEFHVFVVLVYNKDFNLRLDHFKKPF